MQSIAGDTMTPIIIVLVLILLGWFGFLCWLAWLAHRDYTAMHDGHREQRARVREEIRQQSKRMQ